MSFKNKVILITGASSGIGASCAEYFAKEGALLSLVGRNVEKFKKVVDKIEESGIENEPLIIYADVSTDAERIISETIAKYERLDVLINNAGFSIPGTIETTKIEDFDAMMATNVRGLFQITQLAVPHLTKSKGNIVNVSSVLGLRSFTGVLAYAMTKAALDQFTRCVALELAEKGIRVNAVNPGAIHTDFHFRAGFPQQHYPALVETYSKLHPIGRMGYSCEVTSSIAFLASENNGFITGVTLPVDGGVSIKGHQ